MAIMKLFNKTETTLVYIALSDFSSKLADDKINPKNEYIYIHVDREYGSVNIYIGNDINRSVNVEMSVISQIQKFAESDR